MRHKPTRPKVVDGIPVEQLHTCPICGMRVGFTHALLQASQRTGIPLTQYLPLAAQHGACVLIKPLGWTRNALAQYLYANATGYSRQFLPDDLASLFAENPCNYADPLYRDNTLLYDFKRFTYNYVR